MATEHGIFTIKQNRSKENEYTEQLSKWLNYWHYEQE
uniref:Uncharacterized protein n=1 Tax=Setaria italica TaxID=4555 RepID=K3ZGJ5_SETIT